MWWNDHSNLNWSNNQCKKFIQEAHQDPPPRKSSPLNEFKKFTQSNLEAMNSNIEASNNNIEASMNNLENQISQLSR